LQQTTFLEWRDDKDPEEALLESNQILTSLLFCASFNLSLLHEYETSKIIPITHFSANAGFRRLSRRTSNNCCTCPWSFR
jgi:hypothetical protein